jgi:hypothetical protein
MIGRDASFTQDGVAERLRRAGDALGADDAGDATTLRHVLDAHGESARGSVLLLLAVPCLVLPIPGVGTVLGMAMLAMSWAMAIRGTAVLPARAANVELARPRARQLLHTLARVYEHAACVSRERWAGLVGPSAERWILAGIALMGLLIALPIPFGNVLPAIAVALFGLALVMRDGAFVVAGAVVGAAALAVPAALAWGAWQVAGGVMG